MTATPPVHDTAAPAAAYRRRVRPADVAALGGVAGIGVAFLLSPEHIEDGPVICPFRALTGLPCPGCGLTRSWVYAAHGWWRESFASNPFGLVVVAFVLGLAVAVLRRRLRHQDPPDLNRVLTHPVALGVAAVWVTFGVIRLFLAI